MIDNVYDTIVDSIKTVCDTCIPKSSYKPYLKPYWNNTLKDLHRYEMSMRQTWIRNGRPRGHQHPSYTDYKLAKRRFRAYHRQCIEQYMSGLDAEIDTAAELDTTSFWKLYNRRKKRSCNAAGTEINFEGQMCRDSDLITAGWGNYFKELYSPSYETYFDAEHISTVREHVNTIKQRQIPTLTESHYTPHFSTMDVKDALKQCKRGKASGEDMIEYEHLIFGGDMLHEILAKLYSSMLAYSHTPTNMKRGLIVTLHKGGNKRKDDPNNYRAITLSSCILKLYERLILEKITSQSDSSRLSNLQGGFQKGMGCIMTSFLLRESILYAKENHSKLYVCFLDVQKAFDTVWHDGLFFKLDMMNVDSAIIASIMDMYEGAECRVLHNGHRSDSFPVLQGTKQGGVISPFLYLVYIDQLMRNLASVNDGLVIYDQNCSCPTVADDMTLISFSKRGLDAMMGICFNYSRKWHYKYNASKSAVIVFNETKYDFCTRDRTWKLGTEIVYERTEYTHLASSVKRKWETVKMLP